MSMCPFDWQDGKRQQKKERDDESSNIDPIGDFGALFEFWVWSALVQLLKQP